MAVNFSGMCCVMAMPGASPGKLVSTSSNAWVPPVELPITTGLFMAKACIDDNTGARTVIARAAGSVALVRTRGRERAAVFSARIMSRRESSMYCLSPSLGLAMTEMAPADKASSATLLPSVDRVEQITVGIGFVDMI